MATIDSGEKNICDREKIVKEIAKTSESIRRKHRALKTGKMAEDIALEKHFKPIIEPLQKIVKNTVDKNPTLLVSKEEPKVDIPSELSFQTKKHEKMGRSKRKLESAFSDISLTMEPEQKKNILSDLPSSITSTPIDSAQPHHVESTKTLSDDNVFETEDESLEKILQHELHTSKGLQALQSQLGPLGQKYIIDCLSVDKEKKRTVDRVYGVYLSKEGMMLGDKYFDVDTNDNITIDQIKYQGTPGLYELIFRRLPDETLYTKDDMQKYKSILLATNAYRRNHVATDAISGNRGYKYKNIIAPLLSMIYGRKSGKGLPCTMALTQNKIDYVHWNDPNELVDRLRLLEASSRAGNNAHDNEILSIIEELREAGLIIN